MAGARATGARDEGALTAVLLGLAAALAWGGAGVSAAHGARGVGSTTVLAWLTLIGVVIVAPFLIVVGVPDVAASVWAWDALNGAATLLGLGILYRAFAVGKVGVVAPIVATDGALAAIYSVVVGGESLRGGAVFGLTLIALGVVAASRKPDGGTAPSPNPRLAVALAVCASLVFAVGFVAAAHAAPIGAAWVVIPARAIGVVVVAIPVALRGRLRIPRAAVPAVVAVAVLEPGGFAFYVLASRHGVAIPAVLVTQSAVVTAIAGLVVLRERLTRLQVVGVATSAIGVAALAWAQA